MTAGQQFFAGLACVAVALWFLWKAFTFEGPVTELRFAIIRCVCALAAGGSGGFISGAALFGTDLVGTGVKVSSQLAAGVVLFVLVFISLGRRHTARQEGEPSVSLSVGTDMRFDFVAEWLAKEADASIDLSQLSEGERGLFLDSAELKTGTLPAAKRALEELSRLVPKGRLRPYSVALDQNARRFVLVI